MFYLDPQKTILRRDSSLIRPETRRDVGTETAPTIREIRPYKSVLSGPELRRPEGHIRKQLVTLMLESMLHFIVKSWKPIPQPKSDDNFYFNSELDKSGSENLLGKKKKIQRKISKTAKGSRLKIESADSTQEAKLSWWSGPDEKVVIMFQNGNMYEGNISMKLMNGEGRFQWADGTVYLGQFKDNKMEGKGTIYWKDDTWYKGQFAGNLRHGEGLYVDSRLQRSYMGGWHYGTKHGDGAIYYSASFKNSYDGEWIHNERFGFGVREYCKSSGYIGDWDENTRHGKGLMIWPNNDCYSGGWKEGVMSGYGIYIWDAYYNDTMSLASLKSYRGNWIKGKRNGLGVLNFGTGLGSFYKGEFKNNNKNGQGKLVTDIGLIIEDNFFFIDDNVRPSTSAKGHVCRDELKSARLREKVQSSLEPYRFDICDSSIDLLIHIELALQNVDRREEIISDMVSDYIENNNLLDKSNKIQQSSRIDKEILIDDTNEKYIQEQLSIHDFFIFEVVSLRNKIRFYETDLWIIYNNYATIFNTEEVPFRPILIRLYLWQLYYDCKLHEKGLILYDIDLAFYNNRAWLAKNPHDPFEKIYFWQFLHSLLSVANTLYGQKHMPGPRPDTLVASSFTTFMEQDVLPNSTKHSGRFFNRYGEYVPLKATYKLYKHLGEPHTIRMFINAVRHPPHLLIRQIPITDAPDNCIPWGRNAFFFGEEMVFTVDCDVEEIRQSTKSDQCRLRLYNLANITTKTIIKIFSNIFPHVTKDGKVMDLEVKLTFFEFFEGLFQCIEESVKSKEEASILKTTFINTKFHQTP